MNIKKNVLPIIIVLLSTLFLISCGSKNQQQITCPPPIKCPDPVVITKYETIYVPTYNNPLKDMKIEQPYPIKVIQFQNVDNSTGNYCMNKDNVTELIKNFKILIEQRDYYYKIINVLKMDNITNQDNVSDKKTK